MTVENAPPPVGMGYCSVTGKLVPEDELVTIQGQRVCAEGKAILLERLRSGEAMPGELEKPSVLSRFGGILIDGLIIGVPFAILTAVVAGGRRDNFFLLGILSVVSTAASVAYFGLLHARNGQTVGKMAAKTRVVNNLDAGPIAAKTAYLRALAYGGPNFLSALAYFTTSATVIMLAGIVVGVYGLANVVVALVDRNRQRAIHDLIAGTRVIKIQQ